MKHDYFACFYLEIKQMYFLMTTDVESFSIPLNREDDNTAKEVYEVGLPRLLDLYAIHDIKCTFYFTGMFAEQSPESVELVKEHGHEIGCHGYDHSPEKAFDVLSYEEQLQELKRAKAIIQALAGRIESFRAPMLRINNATVKALEETGFKSDSSVASQRFDGPFTFGSCPPFIDLKEKMYQSMLRKFYSATRTI